MNLSKETFKGIGLESDSFAINISCLLGAVRVLQLSDDADLRMTGGNLLDIAHEYADAAAKAEEGDAK